MLVSSTLRGGLTFGNLGVKYRGTTKYVSSSFFQWTMYIVLNVQLYKVYCTMYILEILKKRNHMNPSEIFEKHFTFCRNTEISQVSPLSPRTEGLLRGAQNWGNSWLILKKVNRNEKKRIFLWISGAQHFVAHPLLCVHGDASLLGHLPYLRLGQQGVWQVGQLSSINVHLHGGQRKQPGQFDDEKWNVEATVTAPYPYNRKPLLCQSPVSLFGKYAL